MTNLATKRSLSDSLVALREAPPGLLNGMPPEDQQAIVEVGTPVLLNEYTDQETAELQFTDGNGVIQFVEFEFSERQPQRQL